MEHPESSGADLHDKIKAIKHELRMSTQQVLEELTRDYMTYVMVQVEKDFIAFIFRPDDDEPEYSVEVFRIQIDPRDDKWMITTLGGDFRPKIFYQLAELCNSLNTHKIKNIETWFK